MTQDEIIEMARQAGMDYLKYLSPEAFEKVVVFSKLVAQHERKRMACTQDHWTEYEHNIASAEREACAKDCEGINSIEDFYGERPELICAKAIRARGQA